MFSDTTTMRKVQQLKGLDLYPFFRNIEDSEATNVSVNGKKMVMIGSNNYLGLTHHPHVKEMAIKAIEKYGTGCTGSRFLNGNLDIHEQLEDRLAKFVGMDAALVFSTGMQVNLGVIPAIAQARDCMINDAENHASIIDGNRLSLADNFKYRHNDMDNLKEYLEMNKDRYKKSVIIADGVFSMTGRLANIPEISKLAREYNALTYIDDAHGIGVMGENGRGTLNHFNETENIDLMMGTFSKSFASTGGFVAGRKDLIDYIKHAARSFMFSASTSPSSIGTVMGCLDLIENDSSIHDKLWANVEFMRKGFKEIGLYTYDSTTPIIPVLIGGDIKAFEVTKYLAEQGLFATPVISPAVPKGEALIRTSYMPTHTSSDLEFVLEIFAKAAEKFSLPRIN